jgi:4-deoxy-L-threo-5-hexosulose-uronate ketol-isomerase
MIEDEIFLTRRMVSREVIEHVDQAAEQHVLPMMGEPQQTRPLWVADRQGVASPPWSIHCGSGTASYRFCWAMGGENQAFTDMDRVEIAELR